MLQFMGSQSVRHDKVTELTELNRESEPRIKLQCQSRVRNKVYLFKLFISRINKFLFCPEVS